MEAALKTSFRKELSFVKSSSLSSSVDEFLGVGLQNGAGAAFDDFSVDELLDFSNQEEELFEMADEKEEEEDFDEKAPHKDTGVVDVSTEKDDFDPVPEDDVVSLEWLSHFVEDSNAEYATPFPPGIHVPKEDEEKNRFDKVKPEQVTVFRTRVPARARSKRTRTGVRVWSLGAPPSTESSSSSTSSSGSYSSPGQQTGVWLLSCPVQPVRRPGPGRKSKKVKRGEGVRSVCGAQQLLGGRRCSHCGVQKTPQWRAGPLGSKTLCNACGVRFKSGRLLPEYRPACSPTFSSELHSNSHRKVLEMRKKKEDVVGDLVELPGPTQALVPLRVGPEVPSFGQLS